MPIVEVKMFDVTCESCGKHGGLWQRSDPMDAVPQGWASFGEDGDYEVYCPDCKNGGFRVPEPLHKSRAVSLDAIDKKEIRAINISRVYGDDGREIGFRASLLSDAGSGGATIGNGQGKKRSDAVIDAILSAGR